MGRKLNEFMVFKYLKESAGIFSKHIKENVFYSKQEVILNAKPKLRMDHTTVKDVIMNNFPSHRITSLTVSLSKLFFLKKQILLTNKIAAFATNQKH